MIADNNFSNGVADSKAPPFEELNFMKFKKLLYLIPHGAQANSLGPHEHDIFMN